MSSFGSTTRADVLIVGSGHAGMQLAASLRQGGHKGRLVLLNEEDDFPYQRPPLSKAYLQGKVTEPTLGLRAAAFLSTQGLELIQARATAILPDARRVELSDGSTIPYGELVLATGARLRPLRAPGAEHALSLRSLSDARRIRGAMAASRRAVVVGAGFIGLEFASTARAAGLEVEVLDLSGRLMARSTTAAISAYFRSLHESLGTRFALTEGVERIVHEHGRVRSVQTTAGRELAADFVVTGIGVLPNDGLAAACGLACDNGIRVDRQLRTSNPHISAIGDVACFPHAGRDGHARIESVQNATDQARFLALRLLGGGSDSFEAIPWFWSDQGGTKLQIAGHSAGQDASVDSGDRSAGRFSALSFRGGFLVCVESVNDPGTHLAARKALAASRPLTLEEASLPGFDLKHWRSE
jgi:3-phenylpropionate/trans-cinnamate dioxygenase ferredoxin reductase component